MLVGGEWACLALKWPAWCEQLGMATKCPRAGARGSDGWLPLPAPALGTAPCPVPSSSGEFGQTGRKCYFQVAPCAAEPRTVLPGAATPCSPAAGQSPSPPSLTCASWRTQPHPLTTSLPPPTASEGPRKARPGKEWASPAQLTPSRAYWPPAPRQAQEGTRFQKRNCVSPRPAGRGDPTSLPRHSSIPPASISQPLSTNAGHRPAQRWRTQPENSPA